jgi:prephenate dehydrogenase
MKHPMKKQKKVAIVGVGLLGGSLALALGKQKDLSLVGWNHRSASRKRASRLLRMSKDMDGAIRNSDFVLLCTHSNEIVSLLPKIPDLASPDALIMDVSSVKNEIAQKAARFSWAPYHFVPCHPMAGREKSGPENADAKLYEGKVVFVTPLPKTPESVLKRAVEFWRRVGAKAVVLSPERHDEYVALTSHLPHLLAAALVDTYGKYKQKNPIIERAVGSGFRDTTRITGGNPAMWADILQMNSHKIGFFLSLYRKKLLELENKINKKNSKDWKNYFEKVRKTRNKL